MTVPLLPDPNCSMPENDAQCIIPVKRTSDHSVRWADEMADRFEDVSDEDIELLLEKGDSYSTKNVIKGAVRILQTYCLEKNFYFPYDGTTNADLNTLLTHIFTAVRTKEGKVCCRSVMAYRNISRKC